MPQSVTIEANRPTYSYRAADFTPVAGRNAANQQGPCFYNGSSWYAIGTGTSGANTLIV